MFGGGGARVTRAQVWGRIGAVFTIVGASLMAFVMPAFAAAPTWPSGQYMGVLQNVPFTIPVAITAGAPLTSMTVVTTPSNTTGFGLTNINLTTGTADMVGT